MWKCLSLCIVLTICWDVRGDIGDQMAEVIQKCCDDGSGYARNHIELDCNIPTAPKDVPSAFGTLCVMAQAQCCREYFKKKEDCGSGIDVAMSTGNCGETKDSTKVCCDECSRGSTAGLAGGTAACVSRTQAGSADELLSDDAYTQCCRKSSKEGPPVFTPKPEGTLASVCEDYAPNELCAHHCIPVPGSFKCECNPGFMLMADGRNCREVVKNRCKPKNPCQHKCNDNGVDVLCSCRRGYELMPDGKSCEDIDECQLDIPVCLPGTKCINIRGSYRCIQQKKNDNLDKGTKGQCPSGFARNLKNNGCDDINECKLPRPPCTAYLCENTIGGYRCGGVSGDPVNLSTPRPAGEEDRCPPGFALGSHGDCEDLDECASLRDDCNRLSQFCVNTHSSFYCQDIGSKHCPPGFKIDTMTTRCEDINECEDDTDICRADQICINQLGQYDCKRKNTGNRGKHSCPDGMRVNPTTNYCEDINECVEGTHLCDQHQNCLNTNGSFECHCKLGYELDITTGACVDVNECATQQHDCVSNSQRCDNTVGSFLCIRITSCGTGYILQHSTGNCEDVDECALGTHNCAIAGPEYQCMNIPGSFRCVRKRVTTTPAPDYDEYEYYDSDEEVEGNQSSTNKSETQPAAVNVSNVATDPPPSSSTEAIPLPVVNNPQEHRPEEHRPEENIPEEHRPEQHRPEEDRPDEPTENRPDEHRSTEYRPEEHRPEERRPDEHRSEEHRPTEYRPEEHKPEEHRPTEYRPEEHRPEERRPEEERPEEHRPTVHRPEERKPERYRPEDHRPDEHRPEESLSEETKPIEYKPDDNNIIQPPTYEHTRGDSEHDSRKPIEYVPEVPRYIAPLYTTEPPKPTEPITSPGITYQEPQEPAYRPGIVYEPNPERKDTPDSTYYETRPEKPVISNEIPGRNQRPVEIPSPRPTYSPYSPTARTIPTTPHNVVISVDRETATVPGERKYSLVHENEKERPGDCPLGFENNDNGGCFDIDECATSRHSCSGFTESCRNTIGGYLCDCAAGFRRDLVTGACDLIITSSTTSTTTSTTTEPPPTLRPTTLEPTSTSERALFFGYQDERPLISRPFRARDSCDAGFHRNSRTGSCEDINECTNGQANCAAVEICVNTQGGYRCECLPNWRLDDIRHRCVPIINNGIFPPGYGNEPAYPPPDPQETVGHGSEGTNFVNPEITQIEDRGTVLKCPWGYRLGDYNNCVDVDECTTGEAKCGFQQICTNLVGGYTCSCPRGHRLIGDHECEDVDECALAGNSSICSQHADCVNTLGSYQCKCHRGFRSAPRDDNVCTDVDECSETRAGSLCQHICKNEWGSYRCGCYSGYRLSSDNRTCVDVDECVQYKHKFPCEGKCLNEPGSYRCSCPIGYRLSLDKRSCTDIDECETGEASCQTVMIGATSHLCLNTRGSYHCHRITCPQGYKLASKHRCTKTEKVCQPGDWECPHQATTISYNFITFVSNLSVPNANLKLFTMRGPVLPYAELTFQLRLIKIDAPPSVQKKADINAFLLTQSGHESVISLVHPLEGPQSIELELSMELHSREKFEGIAIAKVFIYVSEYEF